MQKWEAQLASGLRILKDLKIGISIRYKTKDQEFVEKKYQEMKSNFPKSEPYVLTHGDLNLSNIIVKDNKIEAIIDWENAAYLPVRLISIPKFCLPTNLLAVVGGALVNIGMAW